MAFHEGREIAAPILDELPKENDLRLMINNLGLGNTSYPELFLSRLEEIAPIKARLLVHSQPEGFAPEVIRGEWVGTALPIRCQDDIYPVICQPVLAIDAITALRQAQKDEAADWWMQYYEDEWKNAQGYRETFPDFLAYTNFLEFRTQDGHIDVVQQATQS